MELFQASSETRSDNAGAFIQLKNDNSKNDGYIIGPTCNTGHTPNDSNDTPKKHAMLACDIERAQLRKEGQMKEQSNGEPTDSK